MEVALNPLSANSQCHSVEDCIKAVSAYVACCEYCLPAIDSKQLTLLFDEHIEQRSLLGSENFRASIAQLKGVAEGKDLITKWYLYTRNRSTLLPSDDAIKIRLTATGTQPPVDGIACRYIHDQVTHWISLSGDEVCSFNELSLSSDTGSKTIKNSDNIDSFRAWLPSYKPNQKHRRKAYISAGGEYVSPMTLGDTEAQELLLTSIPDAGGVRWAFHKSSSEFYCFRRTHIDQEVFHGFVESEHNVPEDLLKVLRL